MSFKIIESVPTLTLNAISTVGFAMLMYLVGVGFRKKFSFFRSYCIPAAVVGGMLYALINLFLHITGIFAIEFTTTYQSDFQNLFFASGTLLLGMSIIKQGGKDLVKYAVCAVVLVLIQGVIGVFASEAVGLPSAFGLLLGPVPLCGGHGNVAAFGQYLEDAGYSGILVAGMGAACFGLVAGSFFGGPMARSLIRKYGLKNEYVGDISSEGTAEESASRSLPQLFRHTVIFIVIVTVGTKASSILASAFDIAIPGFTGIVILGVLMRMLDDKTHVLKIDEPLVNVMQSFCLNIFLSMSIITLNLWELAELALPMMTVLFVQTVITILFIRFIVFPVCGKNFDSAIMCAALCGHGLGATPNAFANMDTVQQEFGYSPRPQRIVTPSAILFCSWAVLLVGTYMVNLFV